MNFISLEYATLFCVVFVLYYLFPRLQITILLSASLFFYGWSQPFELPLLLLVSMASSTVTYLILKDRFEPQRLMAYGIALNLLVLGFFKYKFLFIEPLTTRAPAGLMENLLYVPLPIGISFYTFHCISLIGDAYRQQFTKDDLSGGLNFSRFLRNGLLYLIFFRRSSRGLS